MWSFNQGWQEDEQRSIQKPSKKSPIPLTEKVDAATKTGLKHLASFHHQIVAVMSFFSPLCFFQREERQEEWAQQGQKGSFHIEEEEPQRWGQNKGQDKVHEGKSDLMLFCMQLWWLTVNFAWLCLCQLVGDAGKTHDCCSCQFCLLISGGECFQKREKGRLPKQQSHTRPVTLSHTRPRNDIITSWPIQWQLQDSKRGRRVFGYRLRQVRIGSSEKPV